MIKRFTIVEYLPNVIKIKDGNQKLDSYEIVDLLNDLAEENEGLKKQLNAFKPIIFEDVNDGGSSILYEKVDMND